MTSVDFANEVSKVLDFPMTAPVSREIENELLFICLSISESGDVSSDPVS
jgi:hypothetical protein